MLLAVPRVVHELVTTEAALDKLGARTIAEGEAVQVPRNPHVLIENLRGRAERPQPRERQLLIGTTDGGRFLTLVIEETNDPESWLVITGWDSTARERRLLPG